MAELVGLPNGEVLVPMFDWKSYFLDSDWKSIKGISKYQHFDISQSDICEVTVRDISDSNNVQSQTIITKDKSSKYIGNFPTEIQPNGLSLERKSYLYKELRKFCRPEDADLTAPKP